MADTLAPSRHSGCCFSSCLATLERNSRRRDAYVHTVLALLAVVALLALVGLSLSAQGSPRATSVDPSSGKANDTVTVAGEYLGKDTVSAVFFSDDKTDYKATLVEQDAEKLVMKVPQVKPGGYNISVQKGNMIYIQPVRFTVQE
ncbi:MAG: IPT/TIG domain-containing protein [Candidatus Acidiferrales bacterium]